MAWGVPLSGLAESPPDRAEGDPDRPIVTGRVYNTPGGTGGAHTVYLHSGEFHFEMTDLQIHGRLLDFSWARKYRSRIGPNTAMGNGWDFSYNIFIEQGGPDILLHDGNTREDLYLFQPATNAWEADEFFREFTFDPNPPPFGTYTLTFADTSQWRFLPLDGSPQQGKIGEISDRNGNTLVFEYDAFGQLVTIHDTLDTVAHTRDITISYNPNGLIQAVTDFTGRSVTYAYYDGIQPGGNFGDLKSVTTPPVIGTPHGNDFPLGKTTVYTYSTGFADPNLNGNLLTITDPKNQSYLVIEYAPTVNPADLSFDRVIGQVWGDPTDIVDIVYAQLIPDPSNNFAVVKATVNDRVGNVSEQFYDGLNRLVIDRDYTGRANPALPTDLDLSINPPVSPLRPGDPPFFETRLEWNFDALPALITHPNGNVTQNIYEIDLNPLAPQRINGNLREIHRMPGALGGDQTQIDEFFEYDPGFGCCGTNFVIRHVDGRGNQTLHSYDLNGNRLQTIHRIPTIIEDFTYNAFGQMTSHTLPDNGSGSRRLDSFTYYTPIDGCMSGYLKDEIIDSPGFGLTTTYEYDCLGRMTRTIDPRGSDTLVEYNALDQVVRTDSRETTTGNGIRYDRLTFYDPNDNIVRLDIENTDDLGVLQPNTHYTTIYEYDILNYVTRSCEEVGNATLGPNDLTCGAMPAAESITTEYEYDANRNATLVRFGEATNGNDPSNIVRTLYDERDLVFEETRAPGSADQSTTRFDYDGNSNVTRSTQGTEDTVAPRITLLSYDGYDRLTTSTDPMGNVTSFHYDANGNVGGDAAPAIPNPFGSRKLGELIDVPGGAGNVPLSVTQYEYDLMDRRTRVITDFFDTDTQTPISVPPTPDGKSVTEIEWTDNSQVRRVVDDNLHQTLTTYDTVNRRSVVTDPKNNSANFVYDPNSNIIIVTETDKSDLGNPDEGFTTTYVYDNLDRMTRTVDNVGNTNNVAYDSRNNRTRSLDALGNETRYDYDGINRLTLTIRDLDGDGADGNGTDITTTQDWDDSSRRVRRIDQNGNITSYVYDALDRLTTKTHADTTVHSYVYDVHHTRTTTTDANGSVSTCTYDLLDRLTNKAVVPGPGVSSDTTFEIGRYDGLSRMTRAEDNDSVVTFSYDSLSSTTAETLNGRTTSSVYDGVGNKRQCTYPGGRVITCTFDELDRKKTISDTLGTVATYDYVGPRRVERREYGNGTRTEYTYDGITGIANPPGDFGVRRIIGTTHSVIGGPIIDSRIYAWDRMYNKLKREDVRPGPRLEHTYEYDDIYRLTRTVVTDENPPPITVRDTTYDLDGVGNRLTVIGLPDPGAYVMSGIAPDPADSNMNQYTTTPIDHRQYDENGNLVATFDCLQGDLSGDATFNFTDLNLFVTGLVAGGPVTCEIDFNKDGNADGLDVQPFIDRILGTSSAIQDVVIRYDYRNRMVEYDDLGAGLRHTYTYDALDRRIVRITDADGLPDETRYFYDSRRVCEEQDSLGTTRATYVYGLYVDEVLTMRRNDGVLPVIVDSYYHCDDLHNVMAVTDGGGATVERYEYDDYGRPEVSDGAGAPIPDSAIGNPYLFTGRRYDPETEWYYYRTRYLDPQAGRFTTRDTIGIWGDAGNLGNGYTYVGNNPWSRVDPLGLAEGTIKRLTDRGFGFLMNRAQLAAHVDCPGHADYIKNMITGAASGGIVSDPGFGITKAGFHSGGGHGAEIYTDEYGRVKVLFYGATAGGGTTYWWRIAYKGYGASGGGSCWIRVAQANAGAGCVQYRETDYNFISRLMEEEGIAGGGGGGGRSTGKRIHNALSVVKVVDKSSPKLYQALCTGEHMKNGTLPRKRPGRTKYSNITLKRGYVHNAELRNWWKTAAQGTQIRSGGVELFRAAIAIPNLLDARKGQESSAGGSGMYDIHVDWDP